MSEGAAPYSSVVQGQDGALYGTTLGKGANGYGSFFRLNVTGDGFTVLKSFTAAEGNGSVYPLVEARAGSFFAIMQEPLLLKLSTAGDSLAVPVGGRPDALLRGADGALYGTTISTSGTWNSGPFLDDGTVFKLNPDGSGFTVLTDFIGGTQGAFPSGAFLQGPDGSLYGTAFSGGANGCGTLFKVNLDGTGLSGLLSFFDCSSVVPTLLVQGSDGYLYGAIALNGATPAAICRVNPDGSGYTLLKQFDGGPDGSSPSSLTWGQDGALYGTTSAGGDLGGGTVFRLVVYPLTQLQPASALAGGPDLTLEVSGAFLPGATLLWNGSPIATTFVSSSQLSATVPSSYLASPAGITTATVTVQNPQGITSNPLLFTVVSPGVGVVQSVIAAPNQSATVATPNISTPLTAPGEAALSATVNNGGAAGPISATVATYTGNPTTDPIIDVGGGYVDLKITGAEAADSATAMFYYPSSMTGASETALTLLYYNGSIWGPVLGSGGAAPAKDTTDNLDSTVSGGRFTVLFDNTSTPKITELSGTVFTMAVPDATAPMINCPADIVTPTDPGQCSAAVNFAITSTDNSGAAKVTAVPPSGSVFQKGTTTVNCTATDGSGNQSTCSFTITVNDTEKPIIACPPNLTALADCSGGAVVTFPTPTATDNCGSPTVVCTPASGSRFPLGTTTVICSATDAAGNSSSCSFAVTVNSLPVNCQPISATLERSRVHFHHGGEAYADFNGDLTLLDGKIPTDFRGASLTAQGRLTVVFGNSSTPAYCNDNITFAVEDVDADDDKEKWEFSGTEHEKISFQWKDRLMYDASLDPALPAHAGNLSSQFIHTSESELRFDFSKATLPVTITVNDIVLVTVASKTSVSSPFSFDAHGQKVDVLWPARLVPGDVVKWYADANPGDGLSGLVYTQTIASGTARETYYNAGGNFDIRVPLSGVNYTDVPRTATVQLVIGPGSSAPGGPLNGCTSFALQTCDQDGDEHWQFNDPDDEDN